MAKKTGRKDTSSAMGLQRELRRPWLVPVLAVFYFFITCLMLHGNNKGITLVLLSAATFALYAVLGKKQCAQYSGVAVTCFSCLAASAEMIVLMLISHIPAVADALQAAGLPMFAAMPFFSGYTTGNLLNVLYICVFVTAGGYACYFMGMEATSAMQGSLVFFFKPVLAPILAMLILGEEIPWNMWAGIGLMLVASEVSMIPTWETLLSVRPFIIDRILHRSCGSSEADHQGLGVFGAVVFHRDDIF